MAHSSLIAGNSRILQQEEEELFLWLLVGCGGLFLICCCLLIICGLYSPDPLAGNHLHDIDRAYFAAIDAHEDRKYEARKKLEREQREAEEAAAQSEEVDTVNNKEMGTDVKVLSEVEQAVEQKQETV